MWKQRETNAKDFLLIICTLAAYVCCHKYNVFVFRIIRYNLDQVGFFIFYFLDFNLRFFFFGNISLYLSPNQF